MVIYKAVGDEVDLNGYNETLTRECAEIYSGDASFDRDWSAMYTQLFKSHCLSTVSYRWENDERGGKPYTHSNIVEVTFAEPLKIVICRGAAFYDGDLSGADKALRVKNALGIAPTAGLMEELGKQGKALLMEETSGEWELVFSRPHLATIAHRDRIIATFAKSPTRALTHRWCPYAQYCQQELGRGEGQEHTHVMRRYECDDICIEELGGEAALPQWIE